MKKNYVYDGFKKKIVHKLPRKGFISITHLIAETSQKNEDVFQFEKKTAAVKSVIIFARMVPTDNDKYRASFFMVSHSCTSRQRRCRPMVGGHCRRKRHALPRNPRRTWTYVPRSYHVRFFFSQHAKPPYKRRHRFFNARRF